MTRNREPRIFLNSEWNIRFPGTLTQYYALKMIISSCSLIWMKNSIQHIISPSLLTQDLTKNEPRVFLQKLLFMKNCVYAI